MTFVPYKPEPTTTMEVTQREANLIKMLRKYAFVKVIVHKANNLLIRMEVSESILLGDKPMKDRKVKHATNS